MPMSVSTQELARAREGVGAVLEALGLDAYLYEVEPAEAQWEVRLECAVAGGWESVRLQADKDDLVGAGEDAAVRQALAEAWDSVLSACLRAAGEKGGRDE